MEISRSTIIKSLLWKYLEKFGVQGVSFVVSVLLARLIAPSEFGLIAIVMILVELSNVVVDGGFNSALIQKKEPKNQDFSTILYVSILASLLLYAILYVAAPHIADFYHEDRLAAVLRVLCIVLLFKAFNSVQSAFISKNMLFKKSFVCNFVAVLISGIVGVALAYMGWGIWALVAQQLLSQIAVCLIMWYYVRWRPSLIFSKESLKELFDFGWKIFLTNIIVAIFKNVRGLVIGRLFNASSLAFFERGKHFPALIVDNLSSTIQAILFPVFSNKQDDVVAVKSMLRRSIKTSSLFVFPSMIGFIVVAKPVIVLLLTDQWLPAVPFVQIFCIAYLLMPIQSANQQVIISLGRSDLVLKLEIIKKIVELLILIISFMYDSIAVAWGIVLYNFICLFINLYPNRQLVNYSYYEQFKDLVPIVSVSIIMGIVMLGCSFINLPLIFVLCVQIIMGILSYIVLNIVFKVEAFTFLIKIIRKNKR